MDCAAENPNDINLMAAESMGNQPGAGAIVVIGIDPGSQCTGWGIVAERSGVLALVACGTVRGRGDDFDTRIGRIFSDLHTILLRHQPVEAAIENVFSGKSAASALKLGQARGAAIAACAAGGIPVYSYEPTKIKQALVGTGRADKAQVSFMVSRLLNCQPVWSVDAGDALAVAICHLNNRRLNMLTGGKRT